ncbi:MAG: glycosyltransferase family 4 protein [Alphaproteobacteria bacterium]
MRDDNHRKLTVLMTADAVGGVWHYALALCAALPETGFVLAVMGPMPSAAQREAAGRLDNVVLEEYGHRLEWMQGAAGNLDSSRHWLTLLSRRYRADLLHVNGYAHARNDTGLPTLAVAHSDVLSWWRAVHGKAAPREWGPYRREVVAGLRAADRVVAPTAAVLDDLARNYGFGLGSGPEAGPGTGIVIPNGIDIDSYAPRPKRAAIMAAGRLWDEAKNLALLDEAAGDLDWPVEIAGEANHPEGGQARLRAARPLGALTPAEMAERLGSAAIYAAPARYEPFGLGILEAAVSGCALVLGDIPSLRENWDGAALFVPPDDAAAWRTTLCCLIACDSRREALGNTVRRRALAFTRERMAARYAGLYRELAGARRGVGALVSRPHGGPEARGPDGAETKTGAYTTA